MQEVLHQIHWEKKGNSALPPGSAEVPASTWSLEVLPAGTVDVSWLSCHTFADKYLNWASSSHKI